MKFYLGVYCAPVVSLAIIILDLVASIYYVNDGVRSMVIINKDLLNISLINFFQTVDGIMLTLEIQNTEEIRPFLEKIWMTYRNIPSIIMLSTTSKFMLLLFFNIFLLVTITPTGWLAHKPINSIKGTQDDNLQKYNINPIPRVNPHQMTQIKSFN